MKPLAFVFVLVSSCSSLNVPMSRFARTGVLRALMAHSKIEPNPLVAAVKVSKTVEVFSTVKAMEAEGKKVTSLCVGEPDFPPPTAVLDATVDAVRSGDTKYTAVTGTEPLRSAIAADLVKRKELPYQPNEILVSNGAKQSVYQGVLAMCGPGDEVIIPAPYWPSYPEMVSLAGATPVILETSIDNDFLIDPQELAKAITDKSKLIIFCNPSNPSGAVHSAALMEEIADVIRAHPNLAVLSDEIYERLVYNEGNPHVSFATFDGMFDRTMTVNGFSKAYAMTGMRLGYMAAPANLLKVCVVCCIVVVVNRFFFFFASSWTLTFSHARLQPCITIQSQLTSCAGSVSQAAGLAALTKVSETEMTENVEIMKGKRDYVLSELSKMPNVKSFTPDGAFYILPDVSSYFNGDDTALCLKLLKEKSLALVPGSSFGAPGCVRLSYATSMEELKVAMEKLGSFLRESDQ